MSASSSFTTNRLGRDGDFDFDASLDVDDDLLDDFGRCVEIDQTLVDSGSRQ